jgi:hypothetical protein
MKPKEETILVIRIPSVLDLEVINDKTTLRLHAVEIPSGNWFAEAKEHACMQYATINAGCVVDDFDMYIDEDGRSPMINDLATHLATIDSNAIQSGIIGDAFLAPTPDHDEEANEVYPLVHDMELARIAYDILCSIADEMDTHVDSVSISLHDVVTSSEDHQEFDYDTDAERRAGLHGGWQD